MTQARSRFQYSPRYKAAVRGVFFQDLVSSGALHRPWSSRHLFRDSLRRSALSHSVLAEHPWISALESFGFDVRPFPPRGVHGIGQNPAQLCQFRELVLGPGEGFLDVEIGAVDGCIDVHGKGDAHVRESAAQEPSLGGGYDQHLQTALESPGTDTVQPQVAKSKSTAAAVLVNTGDELVLRLGCDFLDLSASIIDC